MSQSDSRQRFWKRASAAVSNPPAPARSPTPSSYGYRNNQSPSPTPPPPPPPIPPPRLSLSAGTSHFYASSAVGASSPGSSPFIRRQPSQSTVVGGSSVTTKKSNSSSVVSRVRSVVSRFSFSGRLGFGGLWRRGSEKRSGGLEESDSDLESDADRTREWEQEAEILRRRRMASVGAHGGRASPTPTLEESLKMWTNSSQHQVHQQQHNESQFSDMASNLKDVAGWVDSVPYAAALEDAFGPDIARPRYTPTGLTPTAPSESILMDVPAEIRSKPEPRLKVRRSRPLLGDTALRPLMFLSNLSLTRSNTQIKRPSSPSTTPPRSGGVDSALHMYNSSAATSRPTSVVLNNVAELGNGTVERRVKVPDEFGEVLNRVEGWSEQVNRYWSVHQEEPELREGENLPTAVFDKTAVVYESDSDEGFGVNPGFGPGVPMCRKQRKKHIPVWTSDSTAQSISATEDDDEGTSDVGTIGAVSPSTSRPITDERHIAGRFLVAIPPSSSHSVSKMSPEHRAARRRPPPIVTSWPHVQSCEPH